MKRISIIYAWLSLVLCIVCSSCEWGVPPDYQRVIFFQLSDTAILHKVAVQPYEEWMADNNNGRYHITSKYAIPTYPKLDTNAPYFTELDKGVYSMKGAYYDICELATETKYIPLKNGYYMAYPYVNLVGLPIFLDIDWKDLCNADIDTIPQVSFATNPFKHTYEIDEGIIAKLTKKSTPRYHKRNKEQVTIDDIVALLNQLIEEDCIEDYCNGIGFYLDM